MKQNRVDLTTGSVLKKMIVFAFPLFVTNLLQHLYSAADNAVVGRFAENGELALAAVGATSAATGLILNLVIGLAVGANVVNANLLGAKRHKELRKSLHTSMTVAAVGGVMMSIVGILLARPVLQLMKCPDSIIDLSTLYMRIIFCGTPGTMLYNFGAGILRTHGDSKRPMVIMMFSGILNVVLNLVFVIGFKMTVDGVALATIISKYAAVAWVLYILFNPKGEYKLTLRELNLGGKETLSIIKVGIPCGINSTVFSLANVVVASSINTFGDTVIAGSTAANNVTGLLYQVPAAFYSACVSFSGQCFGAGKYKRIDQLAVSSSLVCCGFVILLNVLITIFPEAILSIFNSNPEVLEAGRLKVIIIAWGYVFYSISDIALGCLRGMRLSAIPTGINIFCVCVIRILWVAFVFPLDPENIMLLYWIYPISNFCSAAAMVSYYLISRKRLFVQPPAEAVVQKT